MTAYELEINALRERIASLEAAYGPFGTHNETHNHVNKRLEKLEAKATPSAPGWSQWNANVETLVEAAQAVVKQHNEDGPAGIYDCWHSVDLLDALEEAVKPFEAAK